MAKLGESLWERIQRARRADRVSGNLRRQNPYFVGRSEKLRRLHEQLGVGSIGVVTAVHGFGGQGKTELAVAYAHGFADCYPAGLWVLGAEGKRDLLALIGELAFSPELNFAPTEAQKNDPVLLGHAVLVELQRRSTESRGAALLILDNVSEPTLLSAAQFGTLPRADWLRIVATTRLGGESLRASQKSLALVPVDSLLEEDALALVCDHQPDQQQQLGLILDATLALLRRPVAPRQENRPPIDDDRAIDTQSTISADAAPGFPHAAREGDFPALTALQFAALLPPDAVPWPWLRESTIARHPELTQFASDEPDPCGGKSVANSKACAC